MNTLRKLEDIGNLMECNVCLCVPKYERIYQCERGHILCSDCRPKLSICPVCRISLGNTRCLIAEKVLGELEEYGCTEKRTKATCFFSHIFLLCSFFAILIVLQEIVLTGKKQDLIKNT